MKTLKNMTGLKKFCLGMALAGGLMLNTGCEELRLINDLVRAIPVSDGGLFDGVMPDIDFGGGPTTGDELFGDDDGYFDDDYYGDDGSFDDGFGGDFFDW